MIARIIALKIFLALLLVGCASTHNKPSTAGAAAQHSATVVKTNVEAAKQNIKAASEAAKAAGKDNSQLNGLLDRIERKQVIIDRWLETQP